MAKVKEEIQEALQNAGEDGNLIITNQGGKTYIGVPNPNRKSLVKVIYTNEGGTQVCSAVKRSGYICATTAIYENGRCKYHDGNVPSGLEHSSVKSGRYSKKLPERLLQR